MKKPQLPAPILSALKSKPLLFASGLVVVGGLIYAGLSQAETISKAFELEAGQVTNPASIVDAPGASGGKAVRFGAGSTGGGSIWKPAVNTAMMWYLAGPLDTNNANQMGTGVKTFDGKNAPDPVMYDIDGFDNTAATVSALHAKGAKVVCYISAGSSEDWRSDFSNFPASVKGKALDGWPGENWLDVRAIDTLKPIMQARLDMCKQKGFDAVEFDNVDGFANDTGFPLTAAHQVAYLKALSGWAHERGMSTALKNNVEQVKDLWQDFDFAINEECNAYDECGVYEQYFIANNKAVFNIEYEGSASTFCPAMNAANINSMKLPLDLNGNRQPCR